MMCAREIGGPSSPTKCEWELKGDPTLALANTLVSKITEVAEQEVPDLSEQFPFKSVFMAQAYFGESSLAIRVIDTQSGQGFIPTVGALPDPNLDYLRDRRLLPFTPRTPADLRSSLGADWVSFRRFTYVGPYNETRACWPHLARHLEEWLNEVVLPEVLRRNRTRVVRAIPQPPLYDPAMLLRACWVLESPSQHVQGTGFSLSGVGIVTCDHVLADDTVAFRPGSPANKHAISVVSRNGTIDLAILRVGHDEELSPLTSQSADSMRQNDHLLVCGFPNYRLGDSGIVSPGIVVGFRPKSSIRRLLTNAQIVRGMSGGPVLGSTNHVVGVAVTGAERLDDLSQTEDLGIIPIDALGHLTA